MSTNIDTDTDTDRIEKEILLKAPQAKVWKALATPEEFGKWFGWDLSGQRFAPGVEFKGNIGCCGHENLTVAGWMVTIEPTRYLSFRWHPYAIDPAVDYSGEPTTLVEFELRETSDGTLLKVVESGFDQLPPGRQAEAFRMNSAGWDGQMKNITAYVEGES